MVEHNRPAQPLLTRWKLAVIGPAAFVLLIGPTAPLAADWVSGLKAVGTGTALCELEHNSNHSATHYSGETIEWAPTCSGVEVKARFLISSVWVTDVQTDTTAPYNAGVNGQHTGDVAWFDHNGRQATNGTWYGFRTNH